MKVEYFVVAFGLLCAGAYFTYARHTDWRNNDSTMVISSDNDYVEIKYSGKISFTDDETAIKSISPGGHLNFRKNDETLFAKSNNGGAISYELSEDGIKIPIDSNGKKFMAIAVREMIDLGMDAEERMNRLYRNGGNRALLNALEHLRNDNTKRMYFEHLLSSDSLSGDELTELIKKAGTSFVADQDKEQVLKRFTALRLRDSSIAGIYLQAVESFTDDQAKAAALISLITLPAAHDLFQKIMHSIGSIRDDNKKGRLLRAMIDTCTMDAGRTNQVLEATDHLTDETQQQQVLMKLMEKRATPSAGYDKLLELISRFRDDGQKKNLYSKLISENNLSEEQWLSLINQTSLLGGDSEKSDFLLRLSQKLPKNENIRNKYLTVAKTITDDSQYGKAVRAVE